MTPHPGRPPLICIGAIVIAGALALAACDGSSGSSAKTTTTTAQPATPPVVDSCRLVTRDELEAIESQEVGKPELRTDPTGTAECTWKLPKETSRFRNAIALAVTQQPDAAAARKLIDDNKVQLLRFGSVDVPGLGDTAYWMDFADGSPGQIKSLFIAVGRHTVKVYAPDLEESKAIAEKALTRLPA